MIALALYRHQSMPGVLATLGLAFPSSVASVVSLAAIPTHLVADMTFGHYGQNEMLYAKTLVEQIADHSLRLFDRGFLCAENSRPIYSVASSALILSEQARIEGSGAVSCLLTHRAVVGQVSVAECLEMQPRAKIVGDVECSHIEMHQGMLVDGCLVRGVSKSVELKLAASN